MLGFLFATAIGVVILLFSADPQTYHQICDTNQYSGKESCTSHNVFYVVFWYLGYWFNASAIVITAIATGFIAWFTRTLKRSTDRLWEAGERQFRHLQSEARTLRRYRWEDQRRIGEQLKIARKSAQASEQSAAASAKQAKAAEDALTKLERPYIFIFGVRGIKQDSETRDFFVEYTVANYGKMPAIIEHPNIGFESSDSGSPPLPLRLFDGHSLLTSPILEAGEERKLIREYMPTGMVGEDVLVQLERRRHHDPGETEVAPAFRVPDGFDVFFRAVIRYRGPFSAGHETGALWLWMGESLEFAVRGGDEYNYVR